MAFNKPKINKSLLSSSDTNVWSLWIAGLRKQINNFCNVFLRVGTTTTRNSWTCKFASIYVLTATLIENPGFWSTTPCRLVFRCKGFKGTCCVHLHCRPRHDVSLKQMLCTQTIFLLQSPSCTLFLAHQGKA